MYRELLLILFIVLLFVLGIIKQCGVIGIAAFFITPSDGSFAQLGSCLSELSSCSLSTLP
jgi:hypothetical protein